LKYRRVFEVDLTQIDGDGDFSCPRCENVISPDDASEETYSIVEPKVNSRGLDKVIIHCNKCSSRILLTGFPLLQELSEIDEEEFEKGKVAPPLQFSRLPRLHLPLGLNLRKLP
jgi:hypothetical protein